jgi:RHS repeat-associated protein
MRKVTLLLASLLCPFMLFAQNTGVGLPAFGSFTQGGFDTVNNQNLNAFISIPIASSPGRGIPLNFSLVNNSMLWKNASNTWAPRTDAAGNPTWGWHKDFPVGGYVGYSTTTNQLKCFHGSTFDWVNVYWYGDYHYVDALGTRHNFGIDFTISTCAPYNNNDPRKGYAVDATGFYVDATAPTSPTVKGPGGMQVVGGVSTAVDTNGNFVTKTVVSSTESDWTDSVGNVVLKIIYIPNTTSPTEIDYKFLDGTGASNYQTIKLLLTATNVKTNFACSGVVEYNGTANLPTELDIPSPVSGTLKYLFSYEPTPSHSGYFTGRLHKVTLPTGGTYEYDYIGANDGINCSNGTALSMNRVVSDGTNTATWNFVQNTSASTTTVTTPQLADTASKNDTVYTFSGGQETSRKIYSNSPGTNLVRTINTTWATNGTSATQVTILEDASTQSEVDTTFDSNGLLDSVSEYDWGTGARGSLLRTTTLSYITSPIYIGGNLIDLVTSKSIKDGSGATQYRQDITYDGVALASCPTGVPQHDDTNYPCTTNYRGNPTAVTTYLDPATPASPITKNFTYDFFGNLRTAQLNCCQNKTWNYSNAAATVQYSQPSSVTRGTSPTQLTTSATYNAYTGLVATSTDENGQQTNYFYDYLRRPTSVVRAADNTSVTVVYDDVNFKTTTTSPIDASHSVQQIVAGDKFGHTLTTTLEDASSTVISIVKNEFNLAGRAYGTSNPYTSGNPSFWTATTFDALGRPTTVTLPDNPSSTATYTYVANALTVQDPAGKKRKSALDGAGRLLTVTEPDSTNTLNQITSYTYTILDALATVTEGSQTRTYSYDALGRLTDSTTPEAGHFNFQYNSFNLLTQRTDARGVLTTYGHDTLNRLSSVSYNVGSTGVPATANVSLTYGLDSSCNSAHGAGCIGQVISMTDGPGSENYTYNNFGQMTQLQKIIGTTTYNTGYLYNLAGEMTQITYPSGRVVVQSVDTIGRLCAIGASGSTCTTGTTYATGYGYNAAQELTGFNYGNGVAATFGYSNDRLQLTSLNYKKGTSTLFGLTYSYGSAGSNNGQIQSITDSVDNGRSVAYTYDPLARISTAVTTGSTGYPKWGLQWAYDRYGNALSETQTAGAPPHYSVSVDVASNRINTSGYAYDPNGNMTNDGTNTLVYDAENRATSATNGGSSGAYTYDGGGKRVKKIAGSTTTVYIFSGSKVVAEYDNGAAVGSPSREYIYSGGALLAKIAGSTTTYYHQDHLSNRLVTDSTGNTLAQLGHFPFGESWYNSSNDKLLFTSYERDAESGNDYAMARFDINRLGRFASPDPLSGSTSDPQSLDRYDYVENDPADFSDPSGLCPRWGPFGINGKVICTSAHGPSSREILDYILVFGYYQLIAGNEHVYGIQTGYFIPVYGPPLSYPFPGSGGGGNNSGTTIGPAPRPRPPCRIVDPFLAALEFTGKLGPELQLGPVKAGFSLYKNFTTGDTGGKIEANAGLVSAQVDNRTPMGGSLGGGTGDRQSSVSFLGFQYNFTTSSLQFSPSKSITLGLQALVGGEVSFNSDTFNQQSAANAACQAQGGR